MLEVGDRVRYLRCHYNFYEDYNNEHFVVGNVYVVEKVYGSRSCFVKGEAGELVYLVYGEFELAHTEHLDIEELL